MRQSSKEVPCGYCKVNTKSAKRVFTKSVKWGNCSFGCDCGIICHGPGIVQSRGPASLWAGHLLTQERQSRQPFLCPLQLPQHEARNPLRVRFRAISTRHLGIIRQPAKDCSRNHPVPLAETPSSCHASFPKVVPKIVSNL